MTNPERSLAERVARAILIAMLDRVEYGSRDMEMTSEDFANTEWPAHLPEAKAAIAVVLDAIAGPTDELLAAVEAAAAELHDNPNRLPLESIPPGWQFMAVVADRGTYIAELWSNDYRRSVSSPGETPRIAVLNAIEGVPK